MPNTFLSSDLTSQNLFFASISSNSSFAVNGRGVGIVHTSPLLFAFNRSLPSLSFVPGILTALSLMHRTRALS